MGRYTRLSCAALLVAANASCKSVDKVGSQVKTVDFATEAGTLVYLAGDQGGESAIFRYLCVGGRDDLATAADIRGKCDLLPPKRFPEQQSIPFADFDRDIVQTYLQSVGDADGRLNNFELVLKKKLVDCLKVDEACDPLKDVRTRNMVAAGHYQAHLMGLMQRVFDGDEIALPVQQEEARPGKAADDEASGFNLADDGPRVLAPAKSFKIGTFTQQVTAVLNTTVGSPKVNVIGFQLTPSCKARISGVSSVVADGQQLVGAAQIIATTGSAFMIRKDDTSTAPLDVSQVQVIVRRTSPGTVRCDITLLGWTAAPPPGPNPPPTPPPGTCNDAKRDLIMTSFTANPGMRHWHYLWHGIRNGWDEMSDPERAEVISRLGPQWGRVPSDDDIGEEFLHMHRVMLDMVSSHLRQNGCDMYQAWEEPPAPNDPNFKTYDRFTPSGGIDQMRQWHLAATNEQQLKGLKLGRFGSWLESSLHNSWHMRHANPSSSSPAFNDLDLFELPTAPEHAVNRKSQSWLGHPYSSHVNPYFWRLHGYVDNRIFTWLKANKFHGLENGPLVEDRTKTCRPSATVRCYKWKRTWDGMATPPASSSSPTLAAAGPGTEAPAAHHALSTRDAANFRSLPRSLRRLVNMNSNMFPVEVGLNEIREQ